MASHSYLGDNLETIRSRNFLNEGAEYELLIVPLRNIILFPGDTLPLRLRNKSYVTALENLTKVPASNYLEETNSFHLGVVNLTSNRIAVGTVGTTSEIRGHRSQEVSSSGRLPGEQQCEQEMIVTAKGCHRFRLLEEARRVKGVLVARVVILSESIPKFSHLESPKSPFPSWVYRNNAVAILLSTAEKLFQESLWLDSAETETLKCDEKAEQNHNSPQGGSNLNKTVSLSSENIDGGDRGSCSSSIRHPSDPSLATFYLASNMTIQDNEKQQLLEAENIVIRLRLIISMLQQHTRSEIACSECTQVLFKKSNLFTVPGACGMVGSYVNSMGYVHNTFTFRDLNPSAKVVLQGKKATEADSWFPGFGWRIASCGCCGSHLGWLFTANPCLPPIIPGCEASHIGGQTDRQRAVTSHSMTLFEYHASNFVKSLKINYFWGIRRSALIEKQCVELLGLEGEGEREGERGRGRTDTNRGRGEEEYRGSNDYGDDVEWGVERDHNDVWDSESDDEDNYIHRNDINSSDSDSGGSERDDVDMIESNRNN